MLRGIFYDRFDVLRAGGTSGRGFMMTCEHTKKTCLFGRLSTDNRGLQNNTVLL